MTCILWSGSRKSPCFPLKCQEINLYYFYLTAPVSASVFCGVFSLQFQSLLHYSIKLVPNLKFNSSFSLQLNHSFNQFPLLINAFYSYDKISGKSNLKLSRFILSHYHSKDHTRTIRQPVKKDKSLNKKDKCCGLVPKLRIGFPSSVTF